MTARASFCRCKGTRQSFANGRHLERGEKHGSKKKYAGAYPVCIWKLDGFHRKKLFHLKGKGQFSQVLLTGVNEKTITAYVDGDGQYEYTIRTGKLKKK